MEIPEEFWEVVIARFEKMPPHMKLVIGGYGSMSKREIVEHLKKRDEIGKFLVRMQMKYLKLFKEEAISYEKAFNHKTRSR